MNRENFTHINGVLEYAIHNTDLLYIVYDCATLFWLLHQEQKPENLSDVDNWDRYRRVYIAAAEERFSKTGQATRLPPYNEVGMKETLETAIADLGNLTKDADISGSLQRIFLQNLQNFPQVNDHEFQRSGWLEVIKKVKEILNNRTVSKPVSLYS